MPATFNPGQTLRCTIERVPHTEDDQQTILRLMRKDPAIAKRVAELTEATGIVATELFWAEDGRLLINEIATRPHNSGHFTWEACGRATVAAYEDALRA